MKPPAILLAAALLICLCGCSGLYPGNLSEILQATDPDDVQTPSDTPEKVFTLSYYTEEGLDPYTSSSRTNSELLRLCYSGLFAVDNQYSALPVLAGSYTVEGNRVFVRLREGVRFSDGTPVTAQDCVASYDRAKEKDTVWAGRFSYIRSYRAEDQNTFSVEFVSYAPSQLNLLTVPIVKVGSTDPAGYPVGCGRYRFENSEALGLVKADCNCAEGRFAVDKIALLGIADREAMIYNFNYGRLQAVYADLSLGAAEYRSDNEIVPLPTNRFAFLVVNKSRTELANINFSLGLTYLINRTSLTEEVLNGFATPVWYPLNPAWSETKEANLNPEITSTLTAGAAFTEAGFVLNKDVREYNKKPVTLRLLVNRENASRVKAAKAIAKALQEAGFATQVVEATWDEYQIAVKNLDFDLYLGEVNLPDNLELSGLFSPAVCNTGEKPGVYDALKAEAQEVIAGTGDIRTFVSNFQTVLPFIPLYYEQDALAVSMDVTGTFGGLVSEFYGGIENWVFTPH